MSEQTSEFNAVQGSAPTEPLGAYPAATEPLATEAPALGWGSPAWGSPVPGAETPHAESPHAEGPTAPVGYAVDPSAAAFQGPAYDDEPFVPAPRYRMGRSTKVLVCACLVFAGALGGAAIQKVVDVRSGTTRGNISQFAPGAGTGTGTGGQGGFGRNRASQSPGATAPAAPGASAPATAGGN